MFVTPRGDDTFPLRPVRAKRRGATCDARNTAAPAPSWTVHRRTFPSCRASISARDDAMRSHCAGSHCALPGTGRHEWRPYGSPRRALSLPSRFAPPTSGAPPERLADIGEKKSGERLPGRQECVNLARLVSSRPKSGVPAGTHNETHTFLYYNLITQSTNH